MGDLTWWQEQAGRRPLLTAEQEILYGSAVRQWLDHPENPAPAAIKRRGMRARERLVTSNLRLVISIVTRKYQYCIPPRGTHDPRDLIQEANIGLAIAAGKYDPTLGYRFTTYAYWWIRQAIHRCIEKDRIVKLPGHFNEEIRKLQGHRETLEAELGRPPRSDELAERAGMKPERMQEILSAWRHVWSLEKRLSDDLILGDSIAAPEPDAPDEDLQMLAQQLRWRLEDLTPEQFDIIASGWGLGSGEQEPQAETAQRLGMKRSGVSGIKARAMAQLRQERLQRPPAEPADWQDVQVSPLAGCRDDPSPPAPEPFADRVGGQLGLSLVDAEPLPDVGGGDEHPPPILVSRSQEGGTAEDLNLTGEGINPNFGTPLLTQQGNQRGRQLIRRQAGNLCSPDTQLQLLIEV